MNLNHQLLPHVRRLRLSGILETIDVRNRQAIDEHWSYIEFLGHLLEDEVEWKYYAPDIGLIAEEYEEGDMPLVDME